MFEVLAFVYENYANRDVCPELQSLHRKLYALGFAPLEVKEALLWLEDLKSATQLRQPPCLAPSPASLRLLTTHEQDHLGTEGWGFLSFLIAMGTLASEQLEMVIDRAMAAPGEPINPADLKLIVLMVFWGFGQAPDALLLDELCNDKTGRQLH